MNLRRRQRANEPETYLHRGRYEAKAGVHEKQDTCRYLSLSKHEAHREERLSLSAGAEVTQITLYSSDP